MGERFCVIVPIGGKDAVSVAEFPAYVAGLLPFQRKGDGGGLGAFGLVQRQAGGTREPLPDYLDEGVFVPFDALEAGDEAFAARGTGAEPGDEVHGGHDGRDGLMALRPGFELAGGRGGCRMQAVGVERLKHVFSDCRDADMSPEKLVDGAETGMSVPMASMSMVLCGAMCTASTESSAPTSRQRREMRATSLMVPTALEA